MSQLRQSGQRIVTQLDIARACGVHQTTISMVLRGDPRVSPETTARILATADALGYDAATQDVARRLVQRRYGARTLNQTIGLFFPAHVEQVHYFAALMHGMTDVMADAEFSLLSSYQQAFGIPFNIKLPPCFKREQVDGIIILLPPIAVRALAAQLRSYPGFGDRPILTIGWPVDDFPSVAPDYTGGADQAMRHLLALGHRHVLQYLPQYTEQYETEYVVEARMAGLTRALVEAGLDPNACIHPLCIEGDWTDPAALLPMLHRSPHFTRKEAEADPLIAALRAHPEVTAVLGWNDTCAIRAWYLLRAAGVRVPEEISIVGFDDTDPMPDAEGKNLLTSVHLPLFEIGQLAARTIISLTIDPTAEVGHQAMATTLSVRASTGPA